jgi:hypothetical protein
METAAVLVLAYRYRFAHYVFGILPLFICAVGNNLMAFIGNLTLSLPERQFLARSEHPVICFSTVFGENGQSFSYLSSGATEIVEPFENTVILGSHGPKEKHIFAPSLFQTTQYLIFTDSQTASLTELDRIPAEIFYAEEYGGYFRILFDTGD